ncbi:MAG TPA: zinc ribbon domain-containing protein [Steroidobacteraceae bacterium]|jgi:hypothetical protein|nr:zinc ribbon domain-containing protein [Steroidobacteraceae bacterium]
MKCSICDANNPDDNKYCGRCGAQLNSPAAVALEDQIRAVIKAELKGESSVEVEVAEKIVKRLITWTKVFGVVVGVPLTLLLATFALLGWHSFSDATREVEEAKNTALGSIDTQQRKFSIEAAKLDTDSKSLQTRFERLLEVADNDEALTQQVKSLQKAVNHIEVARFDSSSAPLDASQAATLEMILQKYQRAIAALGYTGEQATVTVHITPDDSDPSRFAYFDQPTRSVWLEKSAVSDPRNMLREYTQIVLEGGHGALAKDYFSPVWAIESGLADYLPSSFMDNPKQGRYGNSPLTVTQPWQRDPVDAFSGRTRRGWAFASICWELRAMIGRESLDKALVKTWLASGAIYADPSFDSLFVGRVLANLGVNRAKAESVFRRWQLLQ